MPNDLLAEFDEDISFQLKDFLHNPNCSDINSCFTYCDTDIDALSEQLGIPWEPSKTVPFSNVVTFLGFHWDLSGKMVKITEKIRTNTKMLSRIGYHVKSIPLKMFRNFMASWHMPALWLLQGMPILPAWKLCWVLFSKSIHSSTPTLRHQ